MAKGHESAEKHGSKHEEWFGPKMKHFLKGSAFTAAMVAVFWPVAVPLSVIAGAGFAGGALSVSGWNAGQDSGKKGGHH
jgi:hypothetical protein